MRSIIQHASLRAYTSPHMSKVVRVQDSPNPLDPEVRSQLVMTCKANREEICGLISNQQGILYVPNSHKEPRFNFYMTLDDLRAALFEIQQIEEQKVIGVFHTHPTNVPWPSPEDISGWPNLALGWRYWIATNHEVVEWSLPR